MKSQTLLQSAPTAQKFPALYRFIVPGHDFGMVYLVTNGQDFDGILVDRGNSLHGKLGDSDRIGARDTTRWERLAPGSSVTLTQE